jgi:hypothetical protein
VELPQHCRQSPADDRFVADLLIKAAAGHDVEAELIAEITERG